MTRVLVMGDVMRDIIVRPAGPVLRGTDQRAIIQTVSGGSGANQAAWLARFGAEVRFVGCVAANDFEPEVKRMRLHGIEPALVPHPAWPTGTLVALVDADGERSFLTDRGANDGLSLHHLPDDVLDGIGHFHLSGYSFVGEATRETALWLLNRVREAAIPFSFDPGSVSLIREIGAAQVLAWTEGAAICVANADEAGALTGFDDPNSQLDGLIGHVDLALIKRGARGCQAKSRDGSRWTVDAPTVDVLDTTGAGDVFFAAFLAARLASQSITLALDRAVAAGAQAVTIIGGWPTV
ncbi:PfkB family carbohydrate kinase [Lichenihabitans sp. PAMC28606]|uniref:carbohydrate kinase family protein n=1 Tax=Lichenihabitans sp. PAMC28606 TaxID=2880932 RepID=UPI001D0B7B78|nr:PfkB family carbohydrate kinase [Lichenihabitans sp. PAMC28606]UDL95691.1 PfkB family carbohydrate kinase [Lichenihabitans sp. PAMC28606]